MGLAERDPKNELIFELSILELVRIDVPPNLFNFFLNFDQNCAPICPPGSVEIPFLKLVG